MAILTADDPKGIPRGFQPKNTLSQASNAHPVPAHGSSSGFPSSNGRKRNQLEIEVSIGDNVIQDNQGLESSGPLAGEPHPKRKRLRSSHSPKCLNSTGSNHGEGLHNHRPKSIVQGLDLPKNPSQSLKKIKDLTEPQKTMDSNKAKTGSRAKREKTESTERVILRSPEASPTRVHSETQIHNSALPSVSRLVYKETARADSSIPFNSASAIKETSQADSDGKSKYFPSERRSERQSRAKQHPDRNGRLRKWDMRNLSSDELESGTTVGNHAVVNLASSDERLRSTSPAKNLTSAFDALPPRDNLGGLARSNIPSTKFRTGANGRQHFKDSPPLNKDYKQEESKLWGVELNYIVGINSKSIKGPDLGLDFNSNRQIYQGQLQGKKLGPDHQINPKTLWKVIVAEDGTKLRFEFLSSKKIDVEIHKKSDVFLLLQHMRKFGLCKIESKPRYAISLVALQRWNLLTFQSEWMEKAFDRREKENGVSSKHSKWASEDGLLDVPTAETSKQQREDVPNIVKLSDERNPKRQRHRLLDGMHQEDYQDARFQVGPEQIKSKDQIDVTTTANSNSLGRDPSGISRLTQYIDLHTPNPHPSKSRAERHRYTRQAKQLPTRGETLQNVIHPKSPVVGTPWRKPLLFPKDGKKKASVEFSDLERLEEGEFLNDNLIGFYLRYLEQRLEETKPEIAKKVYFFNTFFFASLTNTQRGKREINYEAVQNWTRSIDLFAFEYIVIPINESAHWYLAIICNLPAILPDITAEKSSTDVRDTYSLHFEQHIENQNIEAAILSDLPSSPIDKVAHMQHFHSTVDNFEGILDSEDQAPTASFAEMSLETEPKRSSAINPNFTKSKPDDSKSRPEEQGLLDAQINDDLAQVAAQTFETGPLLSECAEEIQNEEGSALPLNQKINVSAKKRKRKSVAPITRMNPNNPAIITFDSLGLTHSPTIRILKNYLREEGRAKRGLEWDDASIKGVTAKDIPQQNNLCDCGVYLLGYVDKFSDDPREFTSKILARQYDVQKDWPRLSPSTLRVSIRKQIISLHEEQQRDQREVARKSDKLHGNEPHAGKRGNFNDTAPGERGREEPQSPQHKSPSLRSSPKLGIKPMPGISKKEASDTALGKDAPVTTTSGEAQSPLSTLLSRERCLQAETNPKKDLTRREALKYAKEIGAPEPQTLINSFEDEYGEGSGVSEDNGDNYLPKPQLSNDQNNETNHAAVRKSYSKDEKTGHLDYCHRFSPSPSVDATDVGDYARKAMQMPRVIEDSQPDPSEEISQNILEQKSSTSVAQGAVRRANEDIAKDFRPPTALELEKQAALIDRLARPSNALEHRENSVIEID